MPIATIIAILQALAQAEPLIAEIVPIVEKMLNGTAPSAADIATLDAAETAINAKLAAQIAATPGA